jgi:antitoxin (DNA-binding transcriptional repressor) of toxin-antitoxin stability system
MREVIGLGQLRSNACRYLDRVGAGETIDVVRHGKLVARIVSAVRNDPRRTA